MYGVRAEDVVGTSIAEVSEGAIPEGAPGPSPAEVLSRIAAGEKGIRFETVRGHRNGCRTPMVGSGHEGFGGDRREPGSR